MVHVSWAVRLPLTPWTAPPRKCPRAVRVLVRTSWTSYRVPLPHPRRGVIKTSYLLRSPRPSRRVQAQHRRRMRWNSATFCGPRAPPDVCKLKTDVACAGILLPSAVPAPPPRCASSTPTSHALEFSYLLPSPRPRRGVQAQHRRRMRCTGILLRVLLHVPQQPFVRAQDVLGIARLGVPRHWPSESRCEIRFRRFRGPRLRETRYLGGRWILVWGR